MWSVQETNEIILPPGATSGERIVISGNGIVQYDAFGNPVFTLEADDANLWLGFLFAIIFGSGTPTNVGNLWQIWNNDNSPEQLAISQFDAATTGSQDVMQFQYYPDPTRGGQNVGLVKLPSINARWQFGNGPIGGYYSEEISARPNGLGGQSVPASTITQMTNLAVINQQLDYPSAWTLGAGTWLCPLDSDYDWCIYTSYQAGVAGSRIVVRVCTTFNTAPFLASLDVLSQSGAMEGTLAFTKFITAGTVLHVEVFQASGAARLLDSTQTYIKICRRF